MKKNPSSTTSSGVWRRLARYIFIGIVSIYLLAVGAGYTWLHHVRKNDRVALLDVALFRLSAVRRGTAAQHFSKAQAAWDAKNYQEAYLYFSAGVRQDMDNVAGRLSAAKFLRSVGAGALGLAMLEDGLARAPEDRRLIEPTFDLLLASGRDRHALELLKQRYKAELTGPNGALLQRYEIEATLAAEGAPAARQLLERHPALLQEPLAARVVARVRWESQERLKAIGVLQEYLRTQPGVFGDYAQLAAWQEAGGFSADAVQTARSACARFPREIAARVLLIEMVVAESPSGSAGPQAIAAYLGDFGSEPESLPALAALAGRKGWVDLSRALYEIAANRQRDLNPLALSYADALAHGSRFKDVRVILDELEAQAPEGNAAFMVQLRQRQVIASAALGDSDNVREYARRLAAVLSREPDGLEACRRIFQKLGIVDAVRELSSRSLTANISPKK